jgi:hypothetical protein
VNLSGVTKASRITMRASLEGTPYKNSWNIWVYPSELNIQYKDVVFTSSFNDADIALR